MAQIGQRTQFVAPVVKDELNRLTRIMRYWHRRNAEPANLNRPVSGQKFNLNRAGTGQFRAAMRAMRHVNRHLIGSPQAVNPFEMVTVFMGDENRIQRGRLEPERLHSGERFARAESAVDQNG